ncbi:MAG TPA: ATP synthase F1 subunit delta [Bacteroidia bacterium]|nr:ATP synthase F1 subunit delta [Bacteroidia bacterium]HNT79656.1 ATP synthase F1 subunit delta [Bacteroidia bacterium]
MSEIKVASRYANSLALLARKNNQLDAVFADMSLIQQTCKSSRDLLMMLRSPVISTDKKNEILEKIFGQKISQISTAFIRIVTAKRREKFLPNIAASFIQSYKTEKGITSASIAVAKPLSDESRAKVLEHIRKAFTPTVELQETIDPSLLGGFLLRVNDIQHDATLSTKMRKLRMEFSKNLYIKDY